MNKSEGRYGLPVALSTVIGIVIGIGIFFKAKSVLLASGGNPKIAMLAWLIGGVITIVSGLTAAEVGAAIPEAGGMFAWIRKLYGRKIGFLVGWAQAFIYTPGLIAVLAYYFSVFLFNYLGRESSEATKYMIAMGAVTFTYLVNIFTKKGGGYIQTTATVIKLIPLIGISILGLASNNNPEPFAMSQEVVQATSGNLIKLVGLALVPIMFAFDGWISVGTISGDLKNAKSTLPKAIIFGIGIVAICYTLLNIAILKVFPADQLIAQGGLTKVAEVLFGPGASKLILLGITISAYGGVNGNILVSTRVPYALALEGNFPKSDYFKVIDEKWNQPMRSSWLMYIVAMTYLGIMWATNDPDTLSNIPVAIFFFFYILVFYGAFILRNKYPEIERPYSVPLYPIVPMLAIIGGIYILYSAIMGGPMYMLVGMGITLVGLLFYKEEGEAIVAY